MYKNTSKWLQQGSASDYHAQGGYLLVGENDIAFWVVHAMFHKEKRASPNDGQHNKKQNFDKANFHSANVTRISNLKLNSK